MRKFIISVAALIIAFTGTIINHIYMNSTIEKLENKISENDLEGYREIFESNMNYFNVVCQKEHVEDVEKGLSDAENNGEKVNDKALIEALKLYTEKLGSYEISHMINIL